MCGNVADPTRVHCCAIILLFSLVNSCVRFYLAPLTRVHCGALFSCSLEPRTLLCDAVLLLPIVNTAERFVFVEEG